MSRGINYYYFMPGPCPCEATHTMCNAKVELLSYKASYSEQLYRPRGERRGLIIIQSDCDLVPESQGVSLSLPV